MKFIPTSDIDALENDQYIFVYAPSYASYATVIKRHHSFTYAYELSNIVRVNNTSKFDYNMGGIPLDRDATIYLLDDDEILEYVLPYSI